MKVYSVLVFGLVLAMSMTGTRGGPFAMLKDSIAVKVVTCYTG